LDPVFKALDRKGLDYEHIADGLAYSLPELRQKNAWIDWNTCSVLYERVETLVGGREAYIEFTIHYGFRQLMSEFLGKSTGLFVSPMRLIEFGVKVLGPATNPAHTSEFERIGPNLVEIRLSIPESFRGCSTYFWGAHAIFTAVPTLLGLETAQVTSQVGPHGSRHIVNLPRSKTLLARSVQTFKSLTVASDISDIIFRQEREIQGRYHELRQAYLLLEQREADLRREITEKNIAISLLDETKAQLAHTQRLDSVSHLAGLLAHDLNNQLQIISGFASLLETTLSDEKEKSHLTQIREASRRSSHIINRLNTFSRKLPFNPASVEPGKIIDELEPLIRSAAGPAIQITYDKTSYLPSIFVDKVQLELSLINLVMNACEAMNGIGELHISANTIQATKNNTAEVLIVIEDTGPGIPIDKIETIFNPFYTTKESGTGLGLSIVMEFTQQSGGSVKVEDSSHGGAKFLLSLPVSAIVSSGSISTGTVPELKNRARILLVDDESSILQLIDKYLSGLGYDIDSTADPREALTLFSPDKYDLVISDVVMPEMTGPMLAAELLHLQPDIRILFITGFDKGQLADNANDIPVLNKPFTMEELASATDELIKNDSRNTAKPES